MAGNWDGKNSDDLWALIEKNLDRLPFMDQFKKKMLDEQQKIGKVNILIAGKTGVGKSTIVNAVFGEDVAPTGAGRPVTDEIRWYEPASLPVRLCDTKGLELANFEDILADLEAEIERSTKSGKIEDRVHVLWLCIAEPGERVEKGEERLVAVCERHRIPTIVVLTKAIGPKSFGATVKSLLPAARYVIRVLASEWDDEPPRPRFGLPDLVHATHEILPEATKNAFDSAQLIVVARKRARALAAVGGSAVLAAAAAATPIPGVDAAAVLAVNIGMIGSVSAIMGVQTTVDNFKIIGGSILAAMAVAGGWRLGVGELLKFIPGIGTVSGGVITSTIAGSATYGLGYAYIEFLCHFHAAEQRMPNGGEIGGFRKFWESRKYKEIAPPKSIPAAAE